ALWHASEQPEPDNPHARLSSQLARAVLERDRQCRWQLLLSPQRLRIQTIGSLCRAITRQLPLASGLGAQPDTLDAPDNAYRQAVHQLLALLEQDHPVGVDLVLLLRHLDNNPQSVEKLLMALLARREQWLEVLFQARHEEARSYLESVLRQVNEEHLDQLTQALGLHASELCAIADQAAANLAKEELASSIAALKGIAGLPPCTPHALPRWQALAELMLTAQGDWRKSPNKNQGFPAGKPGAALKEQLKS